MNPKEYQVTRTDIVVAIEGAAPYSIRAYDTTNMQALSRLGGVNEVLGASILEARSRSAQWAEHLAIHLRALLDQLVSAGVSLPPVVITTAAKAIVAGKIVVAEPPNGQLVAR